MKDEYFAELISRRLDGDLTKEEQDELYAHLADCPECRKLAEDMLLISSLADESMVEPPDTLSASVMRSVKAEKSRRKRLIPGLSGVLAASIAVVLLVRGGYFGGQSETGIPDLNNIPSQDMMLETEGAEEDAELPDKGAGEPKLRSAVTAGVMDASVKEGAEEALSADFGEDEAVSVENDSSAPAEPASDAEVKRAAEPTAAPTVDSASDSTAAPEYFMASGAIAENADDSQYGVDAVSAPRVLYTSPSEQPVENAMLKSAVMSVSVSPDTATNSLNVSSNKLNVDRSDMVAVSYNGNRIAAGEPGFGDITWRVLGYLTSLELSESTDSPTATVEYVVEYADGHSETLLYSADGYLNCNGVWYTLNAPSE